MEALRIEIAEIERLVTVRESFAVETTLTLRTFERRIIQWRTAGYIIVLIFMSLPSAELSVEHMRSRVASGGHGVPEEIVRRRFEERLKNLFQRYYEVVDRWCLDNEGPIPLIIPNGSRKECTRVDDLEKWSTLESRYGR